MASVVVVDRFGNRQTRALQYPPGHLKSGHVVFESAAEEKAYDGSGVPAPRLEQQPSPDYLYQYSPFATR